MVEHLVPFDKHVELGSRVRGARKLHEKRKCERAKSCPCRDQHERSNSWRPHGKILQKSSKVPVVPMQKTRMSSRQWASDDEAGKQRSPSTEAQEPIRSRTGLSLEGMASNPSRVAGKCLRPAALNGVYPMAMALSTIKSMRNSRRRVDRQYAIEEGHKHELRNAGQKCKEDPK